MRYLNRMGDPMSDCSPCCSDPGDDLDPRLVHRLEPLSLLLAILVWDGADEIVTPAVLVDLVRMRNDDDLVDQHFGERAPVL